MISPTPPARLRTWRGGCWDVLEDSVRSVAIWQSLHHWPWNGLDCRPADQQPTETRPERCPTVLYVPLPRHTSPLFILRPVAGCSVDGTEINRMPEGRMIHRLNAVRVSVGMERGRVRIRATRREVSSSSGMWRRGTVLRMAERN